MKKVVDIIKKYDTFIMAILIALISLTFIFKLELGANDPLWNFSNIYKMSNGYKIYNELNVIITPLYFCIGNIIFHIFSGNYLTYYIYQVIIYILVFSACYMLMKKINIKRINAMLYTIIISFITIGTIPEGSYNIFAIFFVIVGIYNVIVNINTNKNRHIFNIFQGIICFFCFLTKQSTGALFIVGMALAQFITLKDKKKTLLNVFEQGITMIILLLGFLFYMNKNNYLNEFINFAFLGMGEFSTNNLKFELSSLIYVVISIIATIGCYLLTYSKISIKENEKVIIRILSVVSFFMIMITYPLFNKAHLVIGDIVFMILMSYMIEILIFRELITGRKIEMFKKVLLIIGILILLAFFIIDIIKYYKTLNSDNYYFDKKSAYYGVISNEKTLEEIKEICAYIKGQNEKGYDVKVLSCYADLYMNVLNKNNGIMDLPFYGNLGKEGVNGLKEKVTKLKNAKILIVKDDEYMHNQESKEILDFIKENFEYEGEIKQFLIYK